MLFAVATMKTGAVWSCIQVSRVPNMRCESPPSVLWAAAEAKPVLLEPIYNITVTVPDEYLGDVMSDVSSRRGKIRETGQQGRYQVVTAQVPLSELYKYSTHLRSITQGRGFHEQEFSHYEDVPGDIQAKVVAESEKPEEDE